MHPYNINQRIYSSNDFLFFTYLLQLTQMNINVYSIAKNNVIFPMYYILLTMSKVLQHYIV